MATRRSGLVGADQKATDDPLKPHMKRRESGRELRAVRQEILEKAATIAEKVSSRPPPPKADSKE